MPNDAYFMGVVGSAQSCMRNISQIVYMEQVFNLILKGTKIKVIFLISFLKTKVYTSNRKKDTFLKTNTSKTIYYNIVHACVSCSS